MRKAKFNVGQVVAVFGIPEIGESKKFIGYHRIDEVQNRPTSVVGKVFYIFDGQVIRQSRLRPLTKRERGA